MLSLQYEVPSAFEKYNLKCYFNIEDDCYRITLFDKRTKKDKQTREANQHQTMLFIPKLDSDQVTEIVKYIIVTPLNRHAELN